MKQSDPAEPKAGGDTLDRPLLGLMATSHYLVAEQLQNRDSQALVPDLAS